METENIETTTNIIGLTKEQYAFIAGILQQVSLPSVPLAQMPDLSGKVVAIINTCVELSK